MTKGSGPWVDYTGSGTLSNPFDDYGKSICEKAGYVEVLTADDRVYDNYGGSIHCATNVIRKTPDYDWWDQ